MKISSDKRVKESSDSLYSYRADTNFQIAVALLVYVGMSLICTHTHMESVAWAQNCTWIKVHLSMYKSEYIVEFNGPCSRN